jgi:hypothetical protein
VEKINILIEVLKANWITILLVIGAGLIILKAVADARVRWAAITPDKKDDEEAEIFEKKTNVIIQFIKDVFRIGDKNEPPAPPNP